MGSLTFCLVLLVNLLLWAHWHQVCCNGLIPTCIAVAYGVLAGCVDVPLGLSPTLEPWRSQAITWLL